MSDQVPFGFAKIAQGFCFAGKFLYAVLSENSKTSLVGLANTFDGKRFAYPHQGYFFGASACPACRCCDSLPHPRDIFCNGHRAKTGPAREDARPSHNCYIIPTGGAGSLGSPALESGMRIIRGAKPTITTIPV